MSRRSSRYDLGRFGLEAHYLGPCREAGRLFIRLRSTNSLGGSGSRTHFHHPFLWRANWGFGDPESGSKRGVSDPPFWGPKTLILDP